MYKPKLRSTSLHPQQRQQLSLDYEGILGWVQPSKCILLLHHRTPSVTQYPQHKGRSLPALHGKGQRACPGILLPSKRFLNRQYILSDHQLPCLSLSLLLRRDRQRRERCPRAGGKLCVKSKGAWRPSAGRELRKKWEPTRGKVAQWVKHSPCKHENQSSDAQDPHKKSIW